MTEEMVNVVSENSVSQVLSICQIDSLLRQIFQYKTSSRFRLININYLYKVCKKNLPNLRKGYDAARNIYTLHIIRFSHKNIM